MLKFQGAHATVAIGTMPTFVSTGVSESWTQVEQGVSARGLQVDVMEFDSDANLGMEDITVWSPLQLWIVG